MKKQCVVVPVDFSDNTEAAVRAAFEFVDNPSQVNVIHVLFSLDAVSPGVVFGGVSDESRTENINEHFDNLKKLLGTPDLGTEVRVGNPGLQITEYAKELGADLIVIPSHGYHGFKRMILGSVAERVIRLAACDVYVLRRSDAE
ncbi:universal stress protein [Planctomycetaceae bacterium]|jgi:nucleotide-binding universal stress UspA family protein|nr:universal stress protein [Planctomycetaceae bacterium]